MNWDWDDDEFVAEVGADAVESGPPWFAILVLCLIVLYYVGCWQGWW